MILFLYQKVRWPAAKLYYSSDKLATTNNRAVKVRDKRGL